MIDMARWLDDDRLREVAAGSSRAFAEARPFPHVVLDDFLDPVLAATLAERFPTSSDPGWGHYHDYGRTEKLAMADEAAMPEPFRQLIWALNSGPMIRFLESLTGISGLVPDPHLHGGGLHRIEPGGFLQVHADFNRHSLLQLDRRLNLLLYLNPDWQPEWGGDLELWDRQEGRVKSVSPVLNRCVIFATTDDALHGHPEPLSCPDGRARCSVALYYYSNGRPTSERSSTHSTLYLSDSEGRRSVARRVVRSLARLRAGARRPG